MATNTAMRKGGRPGKYPLPQPLCPKQPLGLQVPWWSALLGAGKDAHVERAIIHASGVRWRARIERLKTEAGSNGQPKSWTDVARIIRTHLSNATARGKHTHVSVIDVILVAGLLRVPCADLVPESYAAFIQDATQHLCEDAAAPDDVQLYACYWAEHPPRPRGGVDLAAVGVAARQLSVRESQAVESLQKVGQALAPHLEPYRTLLEDMIADGRLL